MQPKEILHSNTLEILFENRNKQYGAYTLRKFYNNRLGMAMGIMLSSLLLLILLLNFTSGKSGSADIFRADGDVVLTKIEVPKPPTLPEPVRSQQTQAASTKRFTNHIQITADIKPTDFPDINDLLNTQIGTTTTHGEPGPTIVTPPNPGPIAAGPTPQPANNHFIPTEIKPSFPGGSKAWEDFLSRNLQAPSDLQAGEQKRVIVRFWVGEDGSVTRFEIMQSGGEAFDKEVLRVLKKMPKWSPAMQNGHAVATSFQQPVIFQSMEE